ncbi:MAG: hypothetical protein MOGMAGMI_01503 [Candidatus Omnitrophica bacterium]|nr:hypothetical protein [Candidatus Omnitrophota bacterium]
MHSFKKFYELTLLRRFAAIFVLTAMFFAGCAPAQQSHGKTVITVWHWMSDREEAFLELARRYQEQTGIEVRFELYAPSEAYAQRVKASAQTNKLPDVFGILGEKRDFASFIKSGYVANLTEAMNAPEASGGTWRESLFPRALSVNEFLNGNEHGVPFGIYGAPLDVMTIQMVYNRELYRQAGLDPDSPPRTWAEFMAHCEALKQKGIPRFVSGFGEIWLIDALASNFAMNIMGEQKVFDTYAGKVPYTDPDWVRTLALFKEMTDAKVFVDGAVTMVNKTAEQTFANSRAAYAFNGSWCVNVYAGMNPTLDYAPMLPPLVNETNPPRIWGGAGSSLVVNGRSAHVEEAIKFLRWFTAESQQAYLCEKTLNLPSNAKSLGQIPPVLAQFADDMDHVTHPSLYPVNELPAVIEAFDKGIQSIMIGEKSPEQVAEEVQRVKEKEMKKQG